MVEIAKLNIDYVLEKNTISKAKRFAEYLPSIESALSMGLPHKTILADLNAQGLTLTMATYTNMLHRQRARVRKKESKTTANRPILPPEKRAELKTAHEQEGIAAGNKLNWDPHKKITW